MTEVLTSVDDLFESPDFGLYLTEWQRTKIKYDEWDGQFYEHLMERSKRANPGSGENDFGETISMYMEMSPEEFESENYYDETAMKISKLRESARFDKYAAKSTLLEFSKNQGANQFAVYGLWLHTRHSDEVTATDLKSKVLSTEKDFMVVDKLIRENPGEVLTVVDLFAYAGRIGVGGITIVEHNNVTIPLAENSLSYGTIFWREDLKIYSDTSLQIKASSIHSIFGSKRTKILENWVGLMDVNSWYDVGEGVTFALGEPVAGPPNIEIDQDKEFLERVFEHVRAVGNAAVQKLEV